MPGGIGIDGLKGLFRTRTQALRTVAGAADLSAEFAARRLVEGLAFRIGDVGLAPTQLTTRLKEVSAALGACASGVVTSPGENFAFMVVTSRAGYMQELEAAGLSGAESLVQASIGDVLAGADDVPIRLTRTRCCGSQMVPRPLSLLRGPGSETTSMATRVS